jgi:hypothetical protein
MQTSTKAMANARQFTIRLIAPQNGDYKNDLCSTNLRPIGFQ